MKGLYLLVLAMALMRQGNNSGIFVAAAVLAYSAWCLHAFLVRQNAILSTTAVGGSVDRLDLPHGPRILVLVVVSSFAAILLNNFWIHLCCN
jgi:hypothetical protein